MATKKVKKFGRGGDILTGLGAGLLGFAAYKALNKDKDDDYTRKVKEHGLKGRFPEDQTHEKADAKKDNKKSETPIQDTDERIVRANKTSKGQPEMGDATNDNIKKTEKYDPNYGQNRNPVVKKAVKKSDKSGKSDKSDKSDKNSAVDKSVNRSFSPFVSGFTPKIDTSKTESVSKPYPVNSKPNEDRPSKTTPMTVREAADKPANTTVPKSFDLKGTNKTVYGTDTTSVFQKRAAEQRADQEAKAKKAAKDKADAEEFRNRPLQPMKKGGAVKKMASGGMARSSASKRADGCAIRGKTRA